MTPQHGPPHGGESEEADRRPDQAPKGREIGEPVFEEYRPSERDPNA